jgi:hypothetical protein
MSYADVKCGSSPLGEKVPEGRMRGAFLGTRNCPLTLTLSPRGEGTPEVAR